MAQQKYSREDVIEALRKSNGIQAAAARSLGCHRNTIQNYIDRYVTVREEYDAQRETRTDLAEQRLMQLINDGYWPAVRFQLMTQGKERGYVERSEQEISGKDGGPLTISLTWGDNEPDDGSSPETA